VLLASGGKRQATDSIGLTVKRGLKTEDCDRPCSRRGDPYLYNLYIYSRYTPRNQAHLSYTIGASTSIRSPLRKNRLRTYRSSRSNFGRKNIMVPGDIYSNS
jgi:hypothetical protein